MSMRISTNTMFQTGTNRLMDLQNDLSKLNQQISSGKRVLTPADDPVAAARILEINQAQQINTTYTSTRNVARTSLETYESNLSSVTDLILDVQSSLVSAGNGAYSNQQRTNIATELQAKLDTLVGLANGKDSQGKYMYAGYDSANPAFSSSG
ncbi:MAG TPA: flagellar hook-associated protein FlgL, partial [Methylophilus sp.]